MPDASIVVTMDDKYSDAVKKMSSVTKSFSKDIDQLEDVLYALNKNKISLKVDLSKAKSELKAAEEQFEKTQSAADGFKLELAQANYDNIVRNLETVTQAAGKAENAISKAGNQNRSADAQTVKTMMTTVAASGIGQMFKDLTMNAGTAVAGSMFGEAGGTIAANMLSSGATGAVAGTAILGPGVGTAIGAAVGAALGGINGYFQNLEKKDDAYKDWYKGIYENAGKETDRMLTDGRSAAQETLGQPEAELNAVRGKLDAAGGEGYYAERNQGIADQIAGADKGPVDEEIRVSYAAHIEEAKPIGATVTVVSVTEAELPVAAAVTLVEGYSTEGVTDQLTTAISDLLAQQVFGQSVTIPYSRFLACLLQCPRVADYSTTFTVNGGTTAVSVAAEAVPVTNSG